MALPLKKLLIGHLPDELLSELIGSYDMVGDIAIIIIPDVLVQWQSLIGDKLLASHPNINVVAKRAGNYQGEYRVLPLEVIAGENRSITEVKEAGIRLSLDLSTSYYSVRSGGERLRIARLITEGEKVLVAFSGIAPYPLVISKHSPAAEIVGVEKNKEAHLAALGNLRLNKKCRNIKLYNDDMIEWAEGKAALFDRAIMPLPKDGRRFLPNILPLLKSGGWLHFYDMQAVGSFEDSLAIVKDEAAKLGMETCEYNIVSAGHTSPYVHRICVDVQIS